MNNDDEKRLELEKATLFIMLMDFNIKEFDLTSSPNILRSIAKNISNKNLRNYSEYDKETVFNKYLKAMENINDEELEKIFIEKKMDKNNGLKQLISKFRTMGLETTASKLNTRLYAENNDKKKNNKRKIKPKKNLLAKLI